MQTNCAEMEQNKLYSIAYKGLKSGDYEFDFQVDDSLFEAYDRVEIKGGSCQAHVAMKRSDTMLELNVTITGEVICECDRCLEDCPIAVNYEGELVVKFSDEIDDYDGEVMWISPSEWALENMGSSTYISQNCLEPSEPYLSMVPMAVSPSMLAFSRLISLSAEDLKVRSS